MLSDTVREGLEKYRIGERIRTMRLKKKLGLVELGQHTGLSPALLSKIERGKMFPTLPTLLRIALVFSVELDTFFATDDAPVASVVRRRDRQRFPQRPNQKNVNFHFESLDYPVTERAMSAYFAEFTQTGADHLEMHQHPGVEFIYVMTGALALKIEDRDTVLRAGDSIYFDSTPSHGYRRHGRAKCTAIVVVTP